MFRGNGHVLDTTNSKTYFPLVSILLAVYRPDYRWLAKQLESLNEQTYKNIELLVYDDCPEEPVDEKIFENYIDNFHYKIIRGAENKGSNKAFEELTKIANGELLAYCDQDDIWINNKIELLVKLIREENAILAYSDMSIIDGNGESIASTLRQVRPRLIYIYGENLFEKLFFSNCIAGCCMLVNSEVAKEAIPFSKVTVHDQWICMIASYSGKIAFIDKQLVKYRIHSNNQTGILTGVHDKSDYYKIRLNPLKQRINEVNKCIDLDLNNIEMFYEARMNKDILKIFKYRYLSKKEAYFEIVIKYMPNWLFKKIIKKLK